MSFAGYCSGKALALQSAGVVDCLPQAMARRKSFREGAFGRDTHVALYLRLSGASTHDALAASGPGSDSNSGINDSG